MWKNSVIALLLAGCAPQMQGVILKIPPPQMQVRDTPLVDEHGFLPCWKDPGCVDLCNRGWRDVSFRIDRQDKLYSLQGNMCMPSEFRFPLGRHIIDVEAQIQTAHGPVVIYKTVHFDLGPFAHPPTQVDIGFYR